MKEQGRAKTIENFKETIARDPYLASLIGAFKIHGLRPFTRNGTAILLYHNKKTGLTLILDPANPFIHIEDQKNNAKFNIPIKTAITIITETYGLPETEEIPKFGISDDLLEDLKRR
jgi:hypothetical protein